MCLSIFFFNDTATTEIYTLSLHDALPIFLGTDKNTNKKVEFLTDGVFVFVGLSPNTKFLEGSKIDLDEHKRSEEHTSELQSRQYLVCRLLLEKKNKTRSCIFS